MSVMPPVPSEDTGSKHDVSVTESRHMKEPEKKESEHDESQMKEDGEFILTPRGIQDFTGVYWFINFPYIPLF